MDDVNSLTLVTGDGNDTVYTDDVWWSDTAWAGFEAGGDGVDGKDLFNMTALLADTGLAGDVQYLGFFANYTLASQTVFATVAGDATNTCTWR